MEHDWLRTRPPLTPEPEALDAILAPSIGRRRRVSMELLGMGLSNTNYRVELDDGSRVVLRLFEREPLEARRELALYERLAGRLPVPRPLDADPEGTRAGLPFVVTEWIEGELLYEVLRSNDDDDILECARVCGGLLAELQRHEFEHAGLLDTALEVDEAFLPFSDGLLAYLLARTRMELVIERVGQALIERVVTQFERHDALLRQIDGSHHLVHGDFKARNIIVGRSRDGQRTVEGLLDWEFAFAGSVAFDIGTFTRPAASLPDGYGARLVAGLLEGGGRAPERVLDVGRMVDTVNQLGFLAREDVSPVVAADSRALLERTVDWLEALPAI